MNEFLSLSPEDLELLESLYGSPTMGALKRYAEACQNSLRDQAVETLTVRQDAYPYAAYRDGLRQFIQTFDQHFGTPPDKELPETKPRSFHEYLP